MAEIVTLAAPVYVDPGAQQFRIALLVFDWEGQRIKVHLREGTANSFASGGKLITAHYDGATAVTLMTALNKANLTTQSLHQRVMARLIADGKLSGSTSGTPD